MSLYQCFLTLPSVLAGKVLAISAQLEPESLICFRRSSSAGVHGVFVRLFLAGGACGAGWAFSTGVGGWVAAGIGAGGVGTGTGVGIWGGCWTGVGTGWGGAVTGAVGVAAAGAGAGRLRRLGAGAGVAAGAGWGVGCCCCGGCWWTCCGWTEVDCDACWTCCGWTC